MSPNETNPILRPTVCSVGSAHCGGLKRCRRSSTGRVRSWDPLAAESLNRVTFESTPSRAASRLHRQRVRCCCPSGQQSTEEPTHASAVFYLETLEREQNGEPQWGRAALGADGLVLNALCCGTPAGFRLGRKSRRGVCPPMEEPTLGERVTVPPRSRACVSLGGAPPSSPNPSSSRITTHQGLGDHEGSPCDAHLPSLSREPRGFDFKDLQLQLGLAPSAAATVPGFCAQEAGAGIPGNANRGVQSLGTELEASC